MKYIIDKNVKIQVSKLFNRGGQYQRAAETIKKIFGDISLNNPDPLKYLNPTNFGETRIKNVIKYDLSGYCRLITIQENNTCTFKFLGDHNECDEWLNSHKGFRIGVNKEGELKNIFITEDINDPEARISQESDYTDNILANRLKDKYLDIIFDKIPSKLKKMFLEFDSLSDEDDILETCELVNDKSLSELLFDVFILLRSGDIDSAKNRILHHNEEIVEIKDASVNVIENIISNDEYIKFEDLEAEDLKILMDNKSWHEWMLFMHPSQKKVVEMDFSGSARLLGVSGSGKTAIIVKRALRLAKKYDNEKILIITLNRSLASLIKNLVNLLLEYEKDREKLSNQIIVSSYWDYCRDFLINNTNVEIEKKIYNDFVHKHNESIEIAWEEFYQCKNNNDDALVLINIHKSLTSRNINSQEYIKQEFDWIRSALSKDERLKYLDIEREGRHIALNKDFRTDILKGLEYWEDHMKFIGVTDYLGLSQSILKHIDIIKPKYRCILVDEMQDFGTIELQIIRKLCLPNENDIFLSGDIAQIVHTKHHKLSQTGIKIAGQNYLKITKNYRNSREILTAAYNVFNTNIDVSSYNSNDFEILNPEYANFSTPKPFLRKTSSLNNGFNFSLKYLADLLDTNKNEKGCIAICGYTYYDVLKIGKDLNIPVLDGKMDLTNNSIFLSDLDNTKGFEFDRMIIINCNYGILPNFVQPKEEWFRDISKLYVAMTRAKKELIISYNNEISHVFKNSFEFFTSDNWTDHLEISQISDYKIPKSETIQALDNTDFNSMSGKDFVLSQKILGLSLELQNKLIDIINGKNTSDHKNRKLSFANMGLFIDYLKSRNRDIPHLTRLFGPSVFKEIDEIIKTM